MRHPGRFDQTIDRAPKGSRENVDWKLVGLSPWPVWSTMRTAGLLYIISFTIREDGRLIDGTTIADAIYQEKDGISRFAGERYDRHDGEAIL